MRPLLTGLVLACLSTVALAQTPTPKKPPVQAKLAAALGAGLLLALLTNFACRDPWWGPVTSYG
jgi:hypothetical protein